MYTDIQIHTLENQVLRSFRDFSARSKVRTILEEWFRPRVFKTAPRVVVACTRPSSAHGRIAFYCAFQSKAKALAFERYLKSHSGKAFAAKRLL
jgi:hypothetical protein